MTKEITITKEDYIKSTGTWSPYSCALFQAITRQMPELNATCVGVDVICKRSGQFTQTLGHINPPFEYRDLLLAKQSVFDGTDWSFKTTFTSSDDQ